MPPQRGVITPALHPCGCCSNVVLCCACAQGGFSTAAPTLSKINGERLERYALPLCGDCFGVECKRNTAYAANSIELDREIEAARILHESCLLRRNALVERAHADDEAHAAALAAADGGAPPPQGETLPPESHDGPEDTRAPPLQPRCDALLPGTIVRLVSRVPAATALVLSAGVDTARVGILPAEDSFTCAPEHFVTSEDVQLSGVVSLSRLPMASGRTSSSVSLFGCRTFSAFRVPGYAFGILKTGFDQPFRMGDRCCMRDDYSLSSVGEDAVLLFSGGVKSTTGAWCVVVVTCIEVESGVVEPTILVLHSAPSRCFATARPRIRAPSWRSCNGCAARTRRALNIRCVTPSARSFKPQAWTSARCRSRKSALRCQPGASVLRPL